MFTRVSLFSLFALISLILFGCSSGNPVNPGIVITPDSQEKLTPLFIAESTVDGVTIGRGLLGAFDLTIDPSVPSAELVPIRQSSAEGDSYLLNLTPYFTVTPCKDCLAVESVAINASNQLVLTFRASHPFPPANIADPPTAKNRDDLRLFDVKLIALIEGDMEFDRLGIALAPDIIVNADGFTNIENRLLDRTNDIDSNAFPYVILGEDASNGNVDPLSPTGFTDLTNATGHNVFNQGGTYRGDMVFNFHFGGVVSMTLFMFGEYGQSSANLGERFTPQYWLPEFNVKEPWKIETEITANGLNDAQASSSATLEVKVWDWQHSSTKIDPNLVDLDAIIASSKIDHIEIEIPGVTQQNIVQPGVVSGTGLGSDPLIYQVTIHNDKLADGGEYWGLVKALDTREQGHNWGSLGELVDFDPTDGSLQFNKVYEFATYQVFKIDVEAVGGPACGPMNVKLQYGRTGDILLKDIIDNEIHILDGSEWKIKAIATCPNGTISSIDFDFDDPNFEDQIAGLATITRTYDNPNCALNDPFELHLNVTIKDDCDATADWTDVVTIYIHCGDTCGPLTAGTVTYALDGGDYQPLPIAGITIPHNSEINIRCDGFTCIDGSIDNYYWDFDDPSIEDQSQSSSSITRTILNPYCLQGGSQDYELGLRLTVADDCPLTADLIRNYTITVECSADCGPIMMGLIEYSLDSSPFTLLPGNSLVVTDDSEIAFRLKNFSSANATITTYSFDFDDPDYTDQSGPDDTITTVYDNPNCVAGEGDSEYITLTYRIADDCAYSADYVGQIQVQVICSSCSGTGLSFTTGQRIIADHTLIAGLDITKNKNGCGMEIADGGGGNLYAGYKGRRVSDSADGIGFTRSSNGGTSWTISRFISTEPGTPAGLGIVTSDGITIVVAWYEQDDNKIYIEKSTNGGINFARTEIYDGTHTINSIGMVQDPNDPSRIYILFVEDDDTQGTSNTIKLLRSLNTGDTFPLASMTTVFSSTQVYNRIFGVADIAVSPVNSDLYIAATQSDDEGSNIMVARSTNFGADFSAGAKVISNVYSETIDSCDIAITPAAPGGQAVYIAYTQGIDRTGDVKLIKGKYATSSFDVINDSISSPLRRPKEASVATDRLGNVYVTWHDDRVTGGNPDVYANISTDNGITFGTDVQVSADTPGTGINMSTEILNAVDNSCEIIVIYESNGDIVSRVG